MGREDQPFGKEITLYKCFMRKLICGSSGSERQLFDADVTFVGTHFQKPGDIKFRSLSIHYSYLDEWVNISGFDIRTNKGETVIKYKKPEPIQAIINDDCKVSIDFEIAHSPIDIVQKEASVKQKTCVKIETSEQKSFEEHREIMRNIQSFLSLGVTEAVYPLAIKGIERHPPVKIYYGLSNIPKAFKTLYPFDMLFTFGDISDRFEVFLRNWFEKADLLQPIYDLHSGILYNPHMYLTQAFLSMVQAIESYHRRAMRNYELPEEEHEKRIEEILSTVPENHKGWLKSKLAYSNEPSLRERLNEVFDKHLEIANKCMENKRAFIQKVVDTRNYLTHYGSRLKARAATGEELFHITQKLRILLQICLLTELGFSLEEIKGFFFRNYRYRQEFTQEQLI